MTMTTLSSEGRLRGLCGGMIKRNRSFMLYFGVLLFVLYPLQYMLHIFDEGFDSRLGLVANGTGSLNLLNVANAHHNETTAILVCMAVFLMALVIGLSQFGYLHSKKAVDVYHELPLNRSTLAIANILTGFATVMIPLAANYLLVLAVGTVKWIINPLFPIIAGGLFLDLLCWAVVVFAVLCIIAFVAVQVGSIFDNFLFSCELLVLFPAIIYLTINLFQHMLRGYTFVDNDFRWILYTSPITLMAEHYAAGGEGLTDPRYLRAFVVVFVWLLIALLLLWATTKLYRKRPSELAESSTSRKPLAQLGVLAGTYIGGSLCGLLFSEISGRMDERWSFVIWTVIFSALIYILAQVILQRGFKGVGKSLLPGAVTVGVIAVFCIILATGGLGYESRVPAAADVKTVTIDYRGRYGDNTLILADTKTPYEDDSMPGVTFYRYNSKRDVDLDSPEAIAAVQRLHMIASDRSLDEQDNGNRYWTSQIKIVYTLQNGRRMIRTYDYRELGAVKTQLLALENTDEFKRETHPVFLMDSKAFSSFVVQDALGFGEKAVVSNQADMQRLMDALKADMMAEDLTKLDGKTELAPCYITFEPVVPTQYLQLTEDAYNNGSVVVRSSYTNTIQVLQQLGLDQFVVPRTQQIASMRIYYDSRFYGNSSPLNMMDMGNLQQYAKEMHHAYDFDEQNDMVSLVEDAAQMAKIAEKMFNIGCVDHSPMTVVFYDANGSYGGCAQI
ncbi:MAG: hypothetical protein J6Q99_04025, partial [Oscillospiraceae bacterium]|nr:hypothetical protein [Oscillospiraceae bacterium]